MLALQRANTRYLPARGRCPSPWRRRRGCVGGPLGPRAAPVVARRRIARRHARTTRPRARAALARPPQPYTCLTARRPSLTPPPCVCRATALLRRAERAPRAWRRRGAHPLLEVRSVRLLPSAACTTLNLSPPHASAPLPTSCSLARCARRCSRPCLSTSARPDAPSDPTPPSDPTRRDPMRPDATRLDS